MNVNVTINEWEFWQRRMAGEAIDPVSLPIFDGEAQTGFYRVRWKRDGEWMPLAYWFEEGVLKCHLRGEDYPEQKARELWTRAAEHPISHELYTAVVAGGAWPDLHPAVTEDRRNSRDGDNDESFEALKDRIDDLSRDADKLIKAGGAKSQDEVDRAADLANRLGELWKQADEARKVEKRVHDEAAKAVQVRWLPILEAADIYRRIKAAVITPFLVAEDTKRRDAEAASLRAAEEANDKGEAPVVAPTPAPTVKAGSGSRRSVSLRTVKDVVIEDRAKVLAFFADGHPMTEWLQSACEKAVRAGATVPGTKIIERQTAA